MLDDDLNIFADPSSSQPLQVLLAIHGLQQRQRAFHRRCAEGRSLVLDSFPEEGQEADGELAVCADERERLLRTSRCDFVRTCTDGEQCRQKERD